MSSFGGVHYIYDSMDYLPFGEQIAGSTGTTHKFTGYERDAESNLDYAMFRYYSSRQGRFMSPDPYNFGANVTNPQSWNGYAYVLNNPLALIDPSGLDDCPPGNVCTTVIVNGESPWDQEVDDFLRLAFEFGQLGGSSPDNGPPVGGDLCGGGDCVRPPAPPQPPPQAPTSTCTINNGRTTAPGPGQATGPGAFGLYPSQNPGMVAIDPMALGLFPGAQTNALLRSNLSQITFNFSPTPSLPAGFPTIFTVGDIAGGNPSPRVGGSAFNGLYDFDIYGLPSNHAASAATSPPGIPVGVTVTFPSSLQQINCGGPLVDPVPPNSGLASNQPNTNGALPAFHNVHFQRRPTSRDALGLYSASPKALGRAER